MRRLPLCEVCFENEAHADTVHEGVTLQPRCIPCTLSITTAHSAMADGLVKHSRRFLAPTA